MQALMSFESAPPFAAPLRFFLTAPLFGALAGLLVLIEGADLFASRWLPRFLRLRFAVLSGATLARCNREAVIIGKTA